MRFLAVIPVICCAAALVLTYLAMFAGSSKGFMQDYALVTLNTSRIGYNIFNTSASTNSNDPLATIINDITNDVDNFIEDAINSIAKEIGLHDFYSAHILTYCEGFYTPGPVPNASLPISDIHENIAYCSERTATFYFNPAEILQNELDKAGHSDIQLKDLQWPNVVEDGFRAMRTAARVTFAFYCISIVFVFIALCLAMIGVFLEERVSVCANLLVGWSAFAAILIASSIATYIAIQSTEIVNQNGQQVGISAVVGSRFLALTWTASGLVLMSDLVWSLNCNTRRQKHAQPKTAHFSDSKYS